MTKSRQGSYTGAVGVTYTIGTLSSLTGLSQHTIRAWERRYHALTPGRSDTNRRIYVTEDVHRLSLLRRIVASGHSIGQVATLTTDQLMALDPAVSTRRSTLHETSEGSESHLASCSDALRKLDPVGLEEGLVRGTAALGILGLLNGVVIPLLDEIDRGWSSGAVSIAQEHMASAVLRAYLDRVRTSLPGPPNAPRLLVTTPRNQHHEIGALMVAIVAAIEAWNVTYLGPNLPASDIAMAVKMRGADAVALSIVFPADDVDLADELRALRAGVSEGTAILVGGRAAASYDSVLGEIGALGCTDLATARDILNQIPVATNREISAREIRPLSKPV